MPRRREFPTQGNIVDDEELDKSGNIGDGTVKVSVPDGDVSSDELVSQPTYPLLKMEEGSAVTQSNSDDIDGATGGDKRNLSLEALFQAAHSELENISKGKDPGKTPQGVKKQILKRVSTEEEHARLEEQLRANNDVVAYLQVPDSVNKGTYVIQAEGGGVVRQLLQINGPQGTTLLSVPSGCAVISNVDTTTIESLGTTTSAGHASDKTKISREDKMKSSSMEHVMIKSLVQARDISTFKTMNQERDIMPGATKKISTVIGVGGRKRKHPQKPGKHVCPYCDRGCAKPSVLQKHIRAHTGERPYPCTTCGFAFKTKSNLYKHCKSRWHLLKVGLSKPQQGDAETSQSGAGDDGDSDDEVVTDDMDISMSSNNSVERTLSPVNSQIPMNIEYVSALSGTESYKKQKRKHSLLATIEDEVETAVKNVKLQSGGMVIDRQSSDEPDHSYEVTVHEVITIPEPVHMTVSSPRDSYSQITTPGLLQLVKDDAQKSVHKIGEDDFAGDNISFSSLLPMSMPRNISTAITQTSAVTMNMPIKVSPMEVNSNAQRKYFGKAFSTNDIPLGDAHSKVNFSRSASMFAGTTVKDSKPSPEKLMERISNLISTNQAIVSTPMAIPPRKRMLRQQSSSTVASTTRQTSVPLLMSSPSTFLNRSASLSDKLASLKSASLSMEAAQPPLSRSLSFQPLSSVAASPSRVPEPIFMVKQNDTSGQSTSPKPVMQLPHVLLNPTQGQNPPKEIKIQFKLPKGANQLPPLRMKPSVDASKLSQIIPSATNSSQLAVMLTSQEQRPTVILPQPNPDPVYVCGGCWQSYTDLEKLKIHQQTVCTGTSLPMSETSTALQTLQIPISTDAESKPSTAGFVKEEKHRPPKLQISRSLDKSELSLGPITMVTPPTPTPSTPNEVRRRGVLQRQKNVVLEMVDPRLPPKRGRPKGARSVDTTYFGGTGMLTPDDKPGSRPPLQRSQSTIESGSRAEEVPEELQNVNRDALWKLMLKGRLLMKRSMSVERMISQEAEKKAEKQHKMTLTPPINTDAKVPLLRSRSYDETVKLENKPVKEVKEKILTKLSKSCLSRSMSIDIPDGEEDMHLSDRNVANEPQSMEIGVLSEQDLDGYKKSSVITNVSNQIIPKNITVFSPQYLVNKLGSPHGISIPVTLSIPVNIANKVPGLLREAKLTDGDGNLTEILSSSINPTDDPKHMETDDIEDHTLKIDMQGEDTQDMQQPDETDSKEKSYEEENETGDVKSKMLAEKSDSIESVDESGSPKKKKNICTLHTIQMAGQSKQVQNKIQAALLLLGHNYPSMKTTDCTTFCCIHKTQPMYVKLGDQRSVSMYSDWRSSPYNPNPQGLSSRQLLDLYQTQRYNSEPRFAVSGKNHYDMEVVQSSYWTAREKEFDSENDELAKEAKIARGNCKLENLTEYNRAQQHNPVPVEMQHKTQIVIEPSQNPPKETLIVSATKDRLKQVINNDKLKKIKIFEGGYKSTEDYVYVRGRGRGKYICGKCGIRCKKPSMLKKHIRTHTDVRPYHCRYCNFSFKTKGNLTKHMKSKTHHKLCMDMGFVPVPTSVDDDCIIGDADDNQEQDDSIIYEDIDGPTVGLIEEVTGGHRFSDVGDEDMDDDDDDDDNDEDDEDDEDDNDEESKLEMNETSQEALDVQSSEDVQLIEVEVVTNPLKEVTGSVVVSAPAETPSVQVSAESEVSGVEGLPNSSLDKEIAAASLLDLSKVSKDTPEGDKSSSSPEKSKVKMSRMLDTVTAKNITLLSTHTYLHGQNTYTQKIAMLQAANKHYASGFAPINTRIGTITSEMPIQSQLAGDGGKKQTNNFGPIVGQFIKPDIQMTDKAAVLGTAGDKIGRSSSVDVKVQYVEDHGHAPREILPIPIKPLDDGEKNSNSHFVCNLCGKTFRKNQQFVLHQEVHKLEGLYRCEDCSVAFQTQPLLDKHLASDKHSQQVSQIEGVDSPDEPRPHKCEECNIAFRIQGHLARHLRSKMHISKLEALGIDPVGSYDQIDFHPISIAPSTSSISEQPISAQLSCQMIVTPKPSTLTTQKIRLVKRPPAVPTLLSSTKRIKLNSMESISRETRFNYSQSGEYEKVDMASNDRVTVEMKSEPIELGEIVPKTCRKHDREERCLDSEAESSEAVGPHKCGICGKTFREISFLKRHLVSHAELRPYVCEYCDAGFTTAQSLKFHLRTHTQDRPYLCGLCGLNFSHYEQLHSHLGREHDNEIDDNLEPSLTRSTDHPASAVLCSTEHPSISLSHSTEHSSIALSHSTEHPPISMSHSIHPDGSTAALSAPKYVITPNELASVSAEPVVPVSLYHSSHSLTNLSDMLPTVSSSAAGSQQIEANLHQLSVESDEQVIELDINNYELQECIERGPDGQEKIIYMLVVPEGKLPMPGQPRPIEHTKTQPEGRQIDFSESPPDTIAPGSLKNVKKIDIKTETTSDDSKHWKVVHMASNSMSLSPIFDNEENQESQGS